MTASPVDTTTDLHAVIAALQAERDAGLAREAVLTEELTARTAELVERKTEFDERIEYQAATNDVLKAMSASPDDPQPVFDLIVERARDLCDAYGATVYEFDGTLIHYRAATGVSDDPTVRAAIKSMFPMLPTREWAAGRAILDRQIIRIDDIQSEPGLNSTIRGGTAKSALLIPLMRGDTVFGALALGSRERGGLSDSQAELLKTFAEQAVIAITSAQTYRALQTRTSDLQESLAYQTATSDVLKVISRSTFDLQPVLDTVVEIACRLCDADQALISRRSGELWRMEANRGFPPEYEEYNRVRGAFRFEPDSPSVAARTAREGRVVHIEDVAAVPGYPEAFFRLGKHRTSLGVPLLRNGETVGLIQLARQRVEPFTNHQIELVSTFADQAVIAIENTRLMTEQREALEQQTATAEVLQVINGSPGNLAPVFEAILEKAHNLCDVAVGSLSIYINGFVHTAATRGFTEEYQALLRPPYPAIGSHQALMRGGPSRQTPDFRAHPVSPEMASSRYHLDRMNLRTGLWVPLRKDGTALGCISAYRDKVQPFSEKEIALLENFAAQAVIAMENARLLGEIKQRQEELRITFENMGDGVAMFDADLRLTAWNRNFQQIIDLPDNLLAERPSYADYLRLLAERGEFGTTDIEEELRHRIEDTDQELRLERIRPDGRVIEVRRNAVPGGGFVLIYSDITERKRSEEEIRAARDAAEAALRDLKTAQANLIQAEKMASLGQLTAGIAHEIKNPLNFVNNFAALSVDLLGELKDAIAPAEPALTEKQRTEVEDISAMLTSNLEKITEHGKRADGIVKAMLEHSRGSSGERRMVDLNALIDEALNLAYHGARAQDQSFSITLERDFGKGIAPIEVNPQDITRVFLNIFSNGFYAATRRARDGGDAGFVPTLKVTTRDADAAVEIHVRDNGTGISTDIRDKLFQPFFTTKPTGEGTGLGLSITYDIVTKAHGGSIAVDSKVGEYSEFTIRLPRNP